MTLLKPRARFSWVESWVSILPPPPSSKKASSIPISALDFTSSITSYLRNFYWADQTLPFTTFHYFLSPLVSTTFARPFFNSLPWIEQPPSPSPLRIKPVILAQSESWKSYCAHLVTCLQFPLFLRVSVYFATIRLVRHCHASITFAAMLTPCRRRPFHVPFICTRV